MIVFRFSVGSLWRACCVLSVIGYEAMSRSRFFNQDQFLDNFEG